jgi:hypothetical protein
MASAIVIDADPASIIIGTRCLLRVDLEDASGDLDICHHFTGTEPESPT